MYTKLVSHLRFILLLIVPVSGWGQKWRVDRYTVENGLQNNIVFSCTQDKKGLMWFATSTGVDRFDGNNFVHYPLPTRNSNYTSYIQVPYVINDASDHLWAASSGNIFLYNVIKDRFELPGKLNEWLAKGRSVTGFTTGDGNRNLLGGVNNGFFYYYSDRETILSPDNFNGYVRCVFQDNKGIIWVGTNKGVRRFLINGDKITELGKMPASLNELSRLTISGIFQDTYGRYWIVSVDKGVYVYDETKDILTPLESFNSGFRDYAIKDIYFTPDGQSSYITTDGAGVVKLGVDLKVAANYLSNEDDIHSLNSNAAYDVFADRFNRLWITTHGGGINVVIPDIQPFLNIQHEIFNRNSLSNSFGKAITEDTDGNLWFGTRKGISKLDKAKNLWLHINSETKPDQFLSDNVLALEADRSNGIWTGTYGGGLYYISRDGSTIRQFRNSETDSTSIGTDYVYTVLRDSKNRIWTGGIRGPVSMLDDITKAGFRRIKTQVSQVNCIIEDSKGQILFGTEKGVYVYSGDSLKNLLGNTVTDKVLALIEYAPGQFRAGTLGGGMISFSYEKGVEKITHASDGLPSDVVCGILKDKNGDLWIGTSKGIAHYMVQTGSFIGYTKADGLAGSQVNYGSAFRTREGEIIFGTTDGFSLFNPQAVKTRAYKAEVVFTGLTVNNKRISPGEEHSILEEQIDELKTLKLSYYQNSVSIDFVNTSPSVSGKHLYSWKLEGFDHNWSLPSTSSTAVYTNLNSGTYTFKVRAIAKGQNAEPVLRELKIVIRPPWWKSGWAYLIYILFGTAAVYAFYTYNRIRRVRKKYAERLKLNTSISHEIRTPLTLIKGPVNALANNPAMDEEDRTNLDLARRNIEKLEKIISQFIDFQQSGFEKMQMQVSKDDLLKLLDEVIASFTPLMKEKHIHFTYRRPAESVRLYFDKDKMEKVFNNLLSNAVKYTPEAKDIEVEASLDSRFITITIADTGIGIPESQQQHIFKGYFRADNTVNIKQTGSGVGLTLAKEFVDMHHGKISFKSAKGKGTTFMLKMPLVNPELEHYLITDEPREHTAVPVLDHESEIAVSNKKILVAEDNDELRNYLEKELGNTGFQVIAAPNGKIALEFAQRHRPDVVITDVMMPEMNGFQLCRAIRRDMNMSHLPVIMLTAIHDKDYLLEGYRSGADDYVKKPFDLAYILTRIDNLLQNRIRFREKVLSVFEQESPAIKEDEEIRWLREVSTLIADHLMEPDFSVETLSEKLAMSRSVLFRKFKQITGESPQQYIIKIRLRKAAELLQQKAGNINEIAFQAGFADPKYFSTVFKKYYGKSPSEFYKSAD